MQYILIILLIILIPILLYWINTVRDDFGKPPLFYKKNLNQKQLKKK